MKEKKCKHCGTVLTGNRRKQFCPECLEYRQKQQKEACLARKKAKALEDKIGRSRLLADVREAKRLGVSYGTYKARQYSEGMCAWWL